MYPKDGEYGLAREVKRGQFTYSGPLADFLEWLRAEYRGAGVLCFTFEPRTISGKPRLMIILERESNLLRFGPNILSHNEAEMEKIGGHFRRMAGREMKRRGADPKKLFTIVRAFDTPARMEANQRMTAEDFAAVRAELAMPSLVEIHPHWDVVVFLFETNKDLEASASSGDRERCVRAYAAAIAKYDEFGYVAEQPIRVMFDSDENFQRKFNRSWYSYWR